MFRVGDVVKDIPKLGIKRGDLIVINTNRRNFPAASLRPLNINTALALTLTEGVDWRGDDKADVCERPRAKRNRNRPAHLELLS